MYIDELRLGNIVVREPEVHVVEDSEDDRDDVGLVGMPFLGSWRYTVDRKKTVAQVLSLIACFEVEICD
jgi:hypothetical protein